MPRARLANATPPSGENELSRRYLAVITRWIPAGMRYYADWPVRPNCGHFFGGVYWYGLETSYPVLALAAAASSPEFDASAAGFDADELRRVAVRGLRYLLFTHDSGPADCVRPSEHLGRPECADTKWGERGLGFFKESQCGHTIAHIVAAAALLGDLLTDEDLDMLGALAADYVERFGRMSPASGVYYDTQMEENAWTGLGLASCLAILPDIADADSLWNNTKLWMFRAAVTPQDRHDSTVFADGREVRHLVGGACTTLPDFTAENHGFVHPSYMSACIHLTGLAMTNLGLLGHETPPHFLWRRRELYEVMKRWADSNGSLHSPQGMDWPYIQPGGSAARHAFANCFLGDPDAALLERRALIVAEEASVANAGSMIPRTIREVCGSVQDPMEFLEMNVGAVAQGYLAHRLMGPGIDPASETDFAASTTGSHYYPSGGVLLHNHGRGISSFSWRNSTTILPAPVEGVRLIGHSGRGILGNYSVHGAGKSRRTGKIVVREQHDRASALLIEDLDADSIRRHVFFCSLPNGKGVSYEVAWALRDIELRDCRLGYLQIVNDPTFGEGPTRRFHWAGGSREVVGVPSASPDDDVRIDLGDTRWVNADDRMGFVFAGMGNALLVDKHYFSPYHAIYSELVLADHPRERSLKAGETAAKLAMLWCPGQDHKATAGQSFDVLGTPNHVFAAVVDGWLCACNWSGAAVSVDTGGETVVLEPMEPRAARLGTGRGC